MMNLKHLKFARTDAFWTVALILILYVFIPTPLPKKKALAVRAQAKTALVKLSELQLNYRENHGRFSRDWRELGFHSADFPTHYLMAFLPDCTEPDVWEFLSDERRLHPAAKFRQKEFQRAVVDSFRGHCRESSDDFLVVAIGIQYGDAPLEAWTMGPDLRFQPFSLIY